MDSPSQYVADLEARLRVALRERDAARDEARALDELRVGLLEAASEAAGVTSAAISRLQRAQPVLEKAIAFVSACARKASDDEGTRLGGELATEVIKYLEGAPS